MEFQQDSRMRMLAVVQLWPDLEQLILHYDREQWALFDKAYERLGLSGTRPRTKGERVEALYNALESYGRFFRPHNSEASFRLIRQRMALAEHVSRAEAGRLVQYFRATNKDAEIDYQIQQLRRRWAKLYPVLAPTFTTDYWVPDHHQIANYTVAQKRFDELKNFYIDCFETFCRVSVIAAGVEGIILKRLAVIPKAKGDFTLEEFDRFKNGSKPDILKSFASDGHIPDAKTRAAIHKETAKLYHENLLIFIDGLRTQSLWYWVKREAGKSYPREHSYFREQPGDLFLSKLSSMVVDITELDESGHLNIVEVATSGMRTNRA